MSLLQFLGVGTVTATKDTDTHEVMVYCPWMFPQAEGRLSAVVQQSERISKNAFGEEMRSMTMKSNSIPAVWKKMDDSNRITAPDVREGTPVSIYQTPGQNTYYWRLDGVKPETFRGETVMYGWNANPHISENGAFDVDNFYMLSMDTRSGLVQFRTSAANGEATTFDIQINTQTGTVTIGGREGNLLKIDDVEHSLTYTNADGTVLRVVKEMILAYAPDSIQMFAEKTVKLKTDKLFIQANTAEVDVGLTKWKGRFEHTGDHSQLGDYVQEGNYDQTGNTTRQGNSTSSGLVIGQTDVRTTIVSLNIHGHTGVEGGDDISGPPAPAI